MKSIFCLLLVPSLALAGALDPSPTTPSAIAAEKLMEKFTKDPPGMKTELMGKNLRIKGKIDRVAVTPDSVQVWFREDFLKAICCLMNSSDAKEATKRRAGRFITIEGTVYNANSVGLFLKNCTIQTGSKESDQ